MFSAAVRESHEKERTRAERTKNWSIIGSVLGALIGVMGSTYINRVRLQVRRGDGVCVYLFFFFGNTLMNIKYLVQKHATGDTYVNYCQIK